MTEERTVQLEITLSLPDTVAREAEASGLLTAQTLESLIKTEIQRRRTEQFFADTDRLAALPGPVLTEAEIEAEIQAVRAERRNKDAGRR
ncbi:MAG: hypothetical protein JOZ51_03460 [Chloroflexi bacterium]|nr:hypothetical protein [Chloroflexota bacterium]